MPDLYNRIQAGTKATSLGTMLFVGGLIMIHPSWGAKMLLLIVFVILSNPLSSHVLARSAHNIGQKLSDKTVCDDLEKDNGDKNNG